MAIEARVLIGPEPSCWGSSALHLRVGHLSLGMESLECCPSYTSRIDLPRVATPGVAEIPDIESSIAYGPNSRTGGARDGVERGGSEGKPRCVRIFCAAPRSMMQAMTSRAAPHSQRRRSSWKVRRINSAQRSLRSRLSGLGEPAWARTPRVGVGTTSSRQLDAGANTPW